MNGISRTIARFLCGSVLACAPLLAQDVKTDYDHSAPLNKIKSYTYGKVQASDPKLEPRITAAIDRVLQQEGLHLVTKNADITVDAIVAGKDSSEYAEFYKGLTDVDYKRGWGAGGFTDSNSSLDQIPVGTFVVDMYDNKTNKLVWRGIATEPRQVKQRKMEDDIDKAVNKMFTKFPPKSAGSVAPNQVENPSGSGDNRTTGTH